MDADKNNNQLNVSKNTDSRGYSSSGGFDASRPAGRKPSGWRIFFGVILGLSVLANIFLFLVLIGMAAVFATGRSGTYAEEVIRKGPSDNKIVVINLQGVIISKKAQDVYRQIKTAREDKQVKGLILRVNSPGGTISGSDQIYHQIQKYRQETGKPVVAFMEGIAASGGYYSSVACEKIVSEPTAITGSIGVIMSYFVLEDFLENKLGIMPVIIKSGLKKDWPSPFKKVTAEQRKYIEDKLINPAYERFVNLVAGARRELTLEQVKLLADGSIYGASEALDKKMIDKIGYIDTAIEEVKALANIDKAKVVEYRKPFSLGGFLSARSSGGLKLDKTMLYELARPEVLYLWDVRAGY